MNTNHKSICVRPGSSRRGDLVIACPERSRTELPAVAHFVPISRCDELSREQYLETGLREMLIAGQRICYSFVLHYDEGDTVGQSPIFVRTRGVTLQSAVKQRLRCWNYLCVHVALQRRDKSGDPIPGG